MNWRGSYHRHASWVVATVLALVCAGIWLLVWRAAPHGYVTFAALNIGQGDGLFIEGPTGFVVMVDAGPNDGSVLRALPAVMPPYRRSIDAVIATHPDADHIGGFVDVLKRYHVGAFIEPGIPDPTQTSQAIEQEVDAEHIPRYIARRGMLIDVGGGAWLEVLYPDVDVSTYVKKTNDGCIVAKLVYGKTSALLTCDAPMDVEDHLMATGSSTDLKSDVLKVAHHGSNYSTSAAFLAAVAPQVAVISVGAHNKYGHPSARVLDVLGAAGVPVLRTDKLGTIIFRSDGQRFWQVD